MSRRVGWNVLVVGWVCSVLACGVGTSTVPIEGDELQEAQEASLMASPSLRWFRTVEHGWTRNEVEGAGAGQWVLLEGSPGVFWPKRLSRWSANGNRLWRTSGAPDFEFFE